MIAGAMCLLPFLLPYHQRPIVSFQAEWFALSLGVAASLAALVEAASHRHFVCASLPRPAAWLIAYAALVAIQAAAMMPPYLSVPLLGVAYLAFAALLMWLGAQFAVSNGTERTMTVLAGFILAGAIANAAAAIIQFYGRPIWLEDLVAGLSGDRAYGNIAQANLFANYIALGEAALIFLWTRGHLRTALAACAGLLLVFASALSGSRSPLLFAAWFAVLGLLVTRTLVAVGGRRLNLACFGMAVAIVIASIAAPLVNGALGLGPQGGGLVARVAVTGGDPRWQAWALGLRIFSDAPLLGHGFGSFAGAAFNAGLPLGMARYGEVWTSPHNILISLLAETGVLGTALVLGGLGIWWWQAARNYLIAPRAELWWVICVAGVATLHSLIEFPLSSAHFLGLTALVMGVGSAGNSPTGNVARNIQLGTAFICILLAYSLAIALWDYVRLDSAYVTGTSMTLASESDAKRDAQIMRDLTHGPLAQPAELQIFLGLPLQPREATMALPMSVRVMRHWPAHAVVLKRAIYLAFAGNRAEAEDLLLKAMQTFPWRCRAGITLLEEAAAHDPAAIEPLLAMARSGATGCR